LSSNLEKSVFIPESKVFNFFLICRVEKSFCYPTLLSPRVVSFAIGLFSFSLPPSRDIAPLEEARLCSLLLDLKAMSMFLDLAFKGPKRGKLVLKSENSGDYIGNLLTEAVM